MFLPFSVSRSCSLAVVLSLSLHPHKATFQISGKYKTSPHALFLSPLPPLPFLWFLLLRMLQAFPCHKPRSSSGLSVPLSPPVQFFPLILQHSDKRYFPTLAYVASHALSYVGSHTNVLALSLSLFPSLSLPHLLLLTLVSHVECISRYHQMDGLSGAGLHCVSPAVDTIKVTITDRPAGGAQEGRKGGRQSDGWYEI